MKKALFIIIASLLIISLTGCIIIPLKPDIELTHGIDSIEKIEIYDVPGNVNIIEMWGRSTEDWYAEHSESFVFVERISSELEPSAYIPEEDYEDFLDGLCNLPFEDYVIIVLAAMDPAYHYSSPLIIITYDDGNADIISAVGQCFGVNEGEGFERSFDCDEEIFKEFIKEYAVYSDSE